MTLTFLDCTLRDGGYYNNWDFEPRVVAEYLEAMDGCGVDVVELGFRFLSNTGFKGACAYTTDAFLSSLSIPERLQVAVMVNGADLTRDGDLTAALETLFPERAENTPAKIARIACHVAELRDALPASDWLAERGYRVGFNLMQVSECPRDTLGELTRAAAEHPIEVLYFADSMGSMDPDGVSKIAAWMAEDWSGELGIHTHDNMGLALQNTMRAVRDGVTWVDSTVTGMGRGPGNARTEELAIEVAGLRGEEPRLLPLMQLVDRTFQPMKERYRWGTNPYYYLSGKYGLHPSYVQAMGSDARYSEEDILNAISHLREAGGGRSFRREVLQETRRAASAHPDGDWSPAETLSGRDVLILGAGPSATAHADAIRRFVERERPIVIAMNLQSPLEEDLIDLRVASHPVRLLADAERHLDKPQPLIAPLGGLPEAVRAELRGKAVHDFGVAYADDVFDVSDTHCVIPVPLVLSYALAVATAGRANRVYLAGLDGYPHGDARNGEIDQLLNLYGERKDRPPLVSITPTRHGKLDTASVYGLNR